MRARAIACAVAILIAPFVSAQAQDAEPSEAEMRKAVAQWLRDVHAPWDETTALCTGSPIERRGLPPDICSKICAPESANCRVPGEVRNFRKDSCQPPRAGGQIECSFAAEFIAINPQVKAAGLPSRGLFDRSGGEWRFIGSSP